jgi:hypothetical protein
MNDGLYRLLVNTVDVFLWGGELTGAENLPREGPAIFISNHLAQWGPIGVICSLPMRVYPWIQSEMVDKTKAAAYLNMDFVERRLGLRPPVSITLAKALSKITVPMLRSLGCIGVYAGYEHMPITYQESLGVLQKDKYLLVFPEDSMCEIDEVTKMSPFQKSVFRLGEMYHEQTQKRLAFYPLAVHESRTVRVGQPYWFNPLNSPGVERYRLKNALEGAVIKMYLEMAGNNYLPVPGTERKWSNRL